MAEAEPHDSGLSVAAVVEAVGACRLARDVTLFSTWRPAGAGAAVFSDDDLTAQPVSCGCGCERLYLEVFRRTPGERWHFLVPVSPADVDQLRFTVAQAAPTYTQRWAAAEGELVRLMSQHPHLVSNTDPPPLLYWAGPGHPLAFSFPPW